MLQILRQSTEPEGCTVPRSSSKNKVSKAGQRREERRGGAVVTKVKGQIM